MVPFKCCLPFPLGQTCNSFVFFWFSILNCKIIALQFCIGFCCTTKRINLKYTHISSLWASLPSFHSTTLGITEHRAGFLALYSNFPLAIWFMLGIYANATLLERVGGIKRVSFTVLNKIHKAPQQPHPLHLFPLYLLFPVLTLNYHHFFLMPLSFHVSGSAHAILFACNLFSPFRLRPSLT